MKFELWLAFVVAYSIISVIPGPSVFMVTGQALTRGTRAAALCIVGDLLGGFVLIALSLFGVGAILATSSELFQIVKWAGVLYMAYLGYCQIVEARGGHEPQLSENGVDTGFASTNSTRACLSNVWAGFLVGVLNPKAVIFYVAFLSQFLDPNGDTISQFAVLTVTSTVIVGTILGGYALLAARARTVFRSSRARRRFGYADGGFLIGGSVLMATNR